MSDHKPLESILNNIDKAVDGDKAGLKAIVGSFGNRAFGPILTLCGLILITPLGAIPGVPIALCVIILGFAGQLLFGREKPWLPDRLDKVELRKKDLDKAKKFIAPVLRKIDGFVRPRMGWAANEPAYMAAALLSIVLALTLIPLGAVPFGAAMPGFIIVVLGLGIMARDGLLILTGFGLSALAGVLIYTLIF